MNTPYDDDQPMARLTPRNSRNSRTSRTSNSRPVRPPAGTDYAGIGEGDYGAPSPPLAPKHTPRSHRGSQDDLMSYSALGRGDYGSANMALPPRDAGGHAPKFVHPSPAGKPQRPPAGAAAASQQAPSFAMAQLKLRVRECKVRLKVVRSSQCTHKRCATNPSCSHLTNRMLTWRKLRNARGCSSRLKICRWATQLA